MNPDDLRRAGCNRGRRGPGREARRRRHAARSKDLRSGGCDARSASRDRPAECVPAPGPGPGRTIFEIKIEELREITDWEKPIFVKVGATRTYYDVTLAVKAGADVVVVDGMQGGTAATQDVFIEHVGIPTLAAIPAAVEALQELGVHRKVQLIVSGGIRSVAQMSPRRWRWGPTPSRSGRQQSSRSVITHRNTRPSTQAIGSAAGYYDDWHEEGRPRRGSRPRMILVVDTPRSRTETSQLGELPPGRWYLKRRRLPARAASPIFTASNPRTSWRLLLRPLRWPAYRWPVRTGFQVLMRSDPAHNCSCHSRDRLRSATRRRQQRSEHRLASDG